MGDTIAGQESATTPPAGDSTIGPSEGPRLDIVPDFDELEQYRIR